MTKHEQRRAPIIGGIGPTLGEIFTQLQRARIRIEDATLAHRSHGPVYWRRKKPQEHQPSPPSNDAA